MGFIYSRRQTSIRPSCYKKGSTNSGADYKQEKGGEGMVATKHDIREFLKGKPRRERRNFFRQLWKQESVRSQLFTDGNRNERRRQWREGWKQLAFYR